MTSKRVFILWSSLYGSSQPPSFQAPSQPPLSGARNCYPRFGAQSPLGMLLTNHTHKKHMCTSLNNLESTPVDSVDGEDTVATDLGTQLCHTTVLCSGHTMEVSHLGADTPYLFSVEEEGTRVTVHRVTTLFTLCRDSLHSHLTPL